MYVILPVCHAEDPVMTARSIVLTDKVDAEILARNPTGHADGINMSKMRPFMVDHNAIVQKYGRYPHRNEVLGRKNTPEEDEYLKTAERYGQ